jgi:hypothetical protein
VGLAVAVGAAVYLYYQPIASYLETRNELATDRAEGETLRVVKAELELRRVSATSVEATQREASASATSCRATALRRQDSGLAARPAALGDDG